MKTKLTHIDYFFFVVAAGVIACALLILAIAYAPDIDVMAKQIFNK
jgi:hypothetical protein